MDFWLVLQLIIVGLFFFMFLRGSKLVWGVGLLTVVSAVLFNTILQIFGRSRTAEDLGFWFEVINGLLLGGAAFWLWGLLRPFLEGAEPAAEKQTPAAVPLVAVANPDGEVKLSRRAASMANDAGGYDLRLLHDQIRQNLGPDDVFDLIFDLEMVENEVVAPTRDMRQTILNIIDQAVERGQMSDLALAVERILTPVPPDHFPRVENLRADSPPTILRRWLLTFYDLAGIEQLAVELEVPWELLGIGSKQVKVRQLLLYLKRRSRLPDLLRILHRDLPALPAGEDGPAAGRDEAA